MNPFWIIVRVKPGYIQKQGKGNLEQEMSGKNQKF